MQRVHLGFRCNNACLFCNQGALRDGPAPLDPTAAILAASQGGGVVAFMGGEPTLFPELPAWVAYARSNGATGALVQTNGRRCSYPTYSRALAEAGTTALEVAFLGSSAPMHDYHTTVEGSFSQTISGVRVARQVGLAVTVTTVVTRSNYRHLAALVTLAHGLGVRQVCAVPVAPAGRAYGALHLHASPPLVAPYLREAERVARTLRVALTVGAPGEDFGGPGVVEPPPPTGRRHLHVV